MKQDQIQEFLAIVKEMRKQQQWFDLYGGFEAKRKRRDLEKKVDTFLREHKPTDPIQLQF